MLKFTNDKTKYGLLPLYEGSNSKVSHIFINGFMSDEKEEYKAIDWQNGLEKFINPSDKKFIYKWESSFDYSKLKNHIPFKNGFKHEMKKFKHLLPVGVSLSTVTRLNPFMILPTSFSSFCLEEWKISKENSVKYGIFLAEEINIQKITNDKIYLYAHSLGVNLVKNTLLELGKQNIFVEKVFLFGGASCIKNENEWLNVCNLTKKGVYNFYTKNDSILKYIYRTVELGSTPIGLVPLGLKNDKLYNKDVSYTVKGHFEYKKNLQTILKNLEL